MSTLALAARTCARYAVPLAIVTLVVMAPLLWIAWRVPVPRDLAGAQRTLRIAWVLAGGAWMLQLVLVAAAAPLVRALATGPAPGQLRALGLALAWVVRGALPCAAAIATVLVGGLALVVPGLALLVVFALTGASAARGMPGPLLDSARAVRAQLPLVAAIVGAMLVVDLALAFGAWKALALPVPKKLAPGQLAPYRDVVRVVAVGLVVVSPLFATALAAVRARQPDRAA